MFDQIIAFSVRNKAIVGFLVLSLVIWGLYSLKQIPIDAVPDITNNQVQVITTSPTLATQEIEQFITTPIELALQNLQRIEEIRSISRFGLSVITVVFDEKHDIYLARQLVSERLKEAEENIPEGLGTPELAPITTGLGEIYNYVLRPEEGYEDRYDPMELRSIQDWIVKRQLSGIEGVAEVSSIGGFLKQYEVAIDPTLLMSQNLSISDIFYALEMSNENTGGAYIEKKTNTYYIRSEGLAKSLEDIENIVVKDDEFTPILIKDVAKVQYGKAPRYGALVRNGKEVVGAKVLMFKGANSAEVTKRLHERVEQIQKSLPEGLVIEPYLVRDKLVKTAIGTVKTNLIEGGLIVIFILVLLLGNWRAGLIVASVIPLSMLFAIGMMNQLGISANLMSLGAIDFGLIVDGAVIIIEAIVHRLHTKFNGQKLTTIQMNNEVIDSSQKIRSSAAFGEIIILMVYIPILALVGIEGKMFKPMAQTVMLAIAGALVLSLTYVPMMAALFLKKDISDKVTWSDHIIRFFQRLYTPVLHLALKMKVAFVSVAVILFAISLMVFQRMGGEFIPTLEEGDLALQHIISPGSSLTQSVETARMIHEKLAKDFPEIQDMVVNIGSAEIPTDPMPVEIGDHALIMKPKSEWVSAKNRKDMFEEMEKSLSIIPGLGFEFTQPIQLRFNELMTGTKADIAIKLYGNDLELSYKKAKEAEAIISEIQGVGSVNVEQTLGMPQIIISYNYAKMAQYGLHVKDVNRVIRSAFAGEKAGVIYEGERRFDLVVRMNEANRLGIEDVANLFITLKDGAQVPLNSVARVELKDAPMQISRDNTNRRIVIGVNVGKTDVESLVQNIQNALEAQINLPSGYYFTYGGEFENLKEANARLMIAVPIALGLIFILLYFTFGSFTQALLIFTAIPFSAIGGIWALQLRGMPFSISAGIGFIALFGVAVLNGIVLIGYFNQLKDEGVSDLVERIKLGTSVRLRPVLMTASVASLGFLPMAISTSGGAEVQRPLATVVIGGLITATILTLVIIPILYSWLETWKMKRANRGFGSQMNSNKVTTIFLIGISSILAVQLKSQNVLSLNDAITIALENHPLMRSKDKDVQQYQELNALKYNLGVTNFYYQGEGLFDDSPTKMNEYGFNQFIPNPKRIRSQNLVNTQNLLLSQMDKDIQANEIRRQVRDQYNVIQYKKAQIKQYSELIVLYESYLEKAQNRVAVGAANRLEPLQITSQLNEFKMRQNQVKIDLENAEKTFGILLNQDSALTTTEELDLIPLDTTNTALNPWLEKAEIAITKSQSEIELLKSNNLVDFNLGYSAQQFQVGGWRSGLQVGANIPLFRSNIKNQVKSQQFAVQSNQYLKQATELQLKSNIADAQRALHAYYEGIRFYETQISKLNPEIVRISDLNYRAGELTYLELLNALNLISQNKLGYLEQVWSYNRAANYLLFLLNK